MAQSVTKEAVRCHKCVIKPIFFVRLVIVQNEKHISSSPITDCGIYFP